MLQLFHWLVKGFMRSWLSVKQGNVTPNNFLLKHFYCQIPSDFLEFLLLKAVSYLHSSIHFFLRMCKLQQTFELRERVYSVEFVYILRSILEEVCIKTLKFKYCFTTLKIYINSSSVLCVDDSAVFYGAAKRTRRP